jgi:hypothetical protein
MEHLVPPATRLVPKGTPNSDVWGGRKSDGSTVSRRLKEVEWDLLAADWRDRLRRSCLKLRESWQTLHDGRCGYEVGKLAHERGARVYGGNHATLFPDELFALGAADAVVRGDGDVVWCQALRVRQNIRK